MNTTTEFDPLFDKFLSHQDFGHGRRKHYMVLKRMIGRYVIYRRIILHDDSFRFDVRSVCPEILSDLYEYLRQESDIVAGHPELSAAFGTGTRIGNIYKTVKDPCLVSSLTGHVDGSTAFARYRDIDIDIKKDLVRILENRK